MISIRTLALALALAVSAHAQGYFASVITTATAANKDYLTIFNGSASSTIKVLVVQLAPTPTAAVVGIAATVTISFTSDAGAACTLVPVVKIDSINPNVPTGIVAGTNCTTDATVTQNIIGCGVDTEETRTQTVAICYSSLLGRQAITLRPGQGIMIRNSAMPSVGAVGVYVEMMISAAGVQG